MVTVTPSAGRATPPPALSLTWAVIRLSPS
jgi:hypothetical protein